MGCKGPQRDALEACQEDGRRAIESEEAVLRGDRPRTRVPQPYGPMSATFLRVSAGVQGVPRTAASSEDGSIAVPCERCKCASEEGFLDGTMTQCLVPNRARTITRRTELNTAYELG